MKARICSLAEAVWAADLLLLLQSDIPSPLLLGSFDPSPLWRVSAVSEWAADAPGINTARLLASLAAA